MSIQGRGTGRGKSIRRKRRTIPGNGSDSVHSNKCNSDSKDNGKRGRSGREPHSGSGSHSVRQGPISEEQGRALLRDLKRRVGIPGRPVDLTMEQIEVALYMTGGIVSRASALLGVSHMTLYNRMNATKETKEKYKEIREFIEEETLDLAEVGMRHHLENLNWDACKWILCRLGARRGYGGEMARFPKGDQGEYLSGEGNTYVQNNVQVNNIKVTQMLEKAEAAGVSREKIDRIRALAREVLVVEGKEV